MIEGQWVSMQAGKVPMRRSMSADNAAAAKATPRNNCYNWHSVRALIVMPA